MVSSLASKFDFLQERAQRKPIREPSIDISGGVSKKTDISHLKEFYLQRLSKTEPGVVARLGNRSAAFSQDSAEAAQPQASGQHVARPSFNKSAVVTNTEELEVMCNNCFTLIKASEAEAHGAQCYQRNETQAAGPAAVVDMKLKKLRVALEARLRDSNSKVNVMRHLTQLRYHIDTASKWTAGCSEIGALSDHTVQQVKQLTATSRVLAPAVYIFSKRIENVIVQKERELRRAALQASQAKSIGGSNLASLDIDRPPDDDNSVADVNSIVSELDSDCGTQYAETLVTQDGPSIDVGNLQDANDYLSLKNEDEQRRWFYAQTLTVKLSLTDKTKARKILISDLYAKVQEERVPIERWVEWIRTQLVPEEEGGDVGAQLGRQPSAQQGPPMSRTGPQSGSAASLGSLSVPGSLTASIGGGGGGGVAPH
mmetsp:Transcript_73948/g.186373  ORF Transcript_73948/g.186373 Transcript_73948/m.186373 type:complete len:427 (+) Transcript_73948:118-1398(+)